MDIEKIAGFLGMAQRAGKMVSGELAAEKAVASGQAAALIVAADASERTKETLLRAAGAKGIPVHSVLTKEELGRCLGKENRAVAALMDKGFAKAFEEKIRN